ncbi:MAG: DUF2179 domain-containing protein, partial [Candidatus Woesearchaeota archaeon]
MDFVTLFSSPWYSYAILPLLIFTARIFDVSLGTIRVIFIARGFKFLAPLLGFFEVLIWLAAINQIFSNLNNFYYYLVYAGGFAAGTFAGIIIENKLSIGKVIIRIITGKEVPPLIRKLEDKGFHITWINAESPDGKVRVVITVVDRHEINQVISIVREFNPHAFYSIEDVRFANQHRVDIPASNWLRCYPKTQIIK